MTKAEGLKQAATRVRAIYRRSGVMNDTVAWDAIAVLGEQPFTLSAKQVLARARKELKANGEGVAK